MPVPAPRMTRRDKWLKPHRPCVQRYFDFCNEVKKANIKIHESCRIVFYMPMPKSWSKKKKDKMHLEPHQVRPDGDNLEKALMDAVFKDDSHIWKVCKEKRWSYEGAIVVEKIIE